MNAPADTTQPSPARIGDRYLLEERIGAGAMGAVWRGTDELLNRTVAVKELVAAVQSGPPNGEGLEEARQRILREGRIGARLQHPHVISMFDVVLHDDRPWLVMEYLPSRSLATVLAQRGPLPVREAAEISRQVADGLAAAHAAGVVHRDVKPGNVLLADDGRVKLTDFGVSRAVDDVQVTRTGLIAGTPAYLAPEVARGREPAAAADVFALGATLYAAVEGRPPFGLDENAYALLHKVATGKVDPPRQAGPLTALIMRLLAPEPGDRPSAAQARDALTTVAAGASTRPQAPAPTAVLEPGVPGPRPVPPPPRAPRAPRVGGSATPATVPRGRPARRGPRRAVPLALVLLAVLLLGGGIVAAVLADGPDTSPPTAAPLPEAPSPTPQPTSEPEPTSEPSDPSAAPAPTTDAPAPPPVSEGGDAAGFVQGYYGLLPDDTDSAWALLSDQARSASGGRGNFDRFYGRFESVTLEGVQAVGEDTVEAFVVFDPFEGSMSRERYRFVVGDRDGEPIIDSFAQQ